MTDLQHQHVQRDLAALQAAEKKFQDAVTKSRLAQEVAEDARRAVELAHAKFHGTVHASSPSNGHPGVRPY